MVSALSHVRRGCARLWRRFADSRIGYVDRVLILAVAAMALWPLVTFVYLACARMRYPYDIEWMEGGALEHVARILDGKNIYVAPSIEFTAYIYTPLYFWVCAAFAKVFGLQLFAMRLVSFLATLGNFALVGLIAYRGSRSRLGMLIASGLFAATFERSGAWFDLARVDSLALFFLLGGACLLLYSERHDVLAGTALAAAFLTKQSMLMVAVPVVAARLLNRQGRGRLTCPVTFAGLVGISVIVLELTSRHWFSFYVFRLPTMHPLEGAFWTAYWRQDLLGSVPFLVVAALPSWFHRWTRGERLLELALLSGAVLSSFSSRLHTGGYLNVLIPVFACLAWQSGAVAGRLVQPSSAGNLRRFVLAACVAQFALLWYPVAPQIPTVADRRAGDAVVAQLAAIPGPVLVPCQPHLARMAGKPGGGSHDQASFDVLRAVRAPEAGMLRQNITGAIVSRKYAAILVDGSWFPAELLTNYVRQTLVLDGFPNAFWPKTGSLVRPRELHIRRP